MTQAGIGIAFKARVASCRDEFTAAAVSLSSGRSRVTGDHGDEKKPDQSFECSHENQCSLNANFVTQYEA
jgi:hypothetical protein